MTEDKPDPPDDKPRGRMNLIVLAVALLIVAIGVWLAFLLAKNLQLQRCEMEGRRNCIALPQPSDQ